MEKPFLIGREGRLYVGDDGVAYGRAVVGKFGNILYGPYERLDPGSYEVTFEIVTGNEFRADGRDLCSVDVASETGRKILAKADVGSEYVKPDSTTPIVLRFAIDHPSLVEYRVHTPGLHPFLVKYDRQVRAASLRDQGNGESKFYNDNIDRFAKYSLKGAKVHPTKDGVILDWMGATVLVRSKEDFLVFQEVFRQNIYKFAIAAPVCVIDIGMNVGFASLYFAKMTEVKIVYAYEPFSLPYGRALENLALNPVLNSKIRPNQIGLAGANEELDVRVSDETISTSIRGLREGVQGARTERIRVREATEALAPVFREAARNQLGVVMKVDCEGSEFAVLESLHKSKLLSEVQALLIEWHKWWSPDRTSNDLTDILLASGFVVFDFNHLENPHASMLYACRNRPFTFAGFRTSPDSDEAEGKQAAPAAKESPAAKPAAPKSKKTAKRNPDQREVLLPIAGGAPAMGAVEQPKKAGVRKKAG